MPPHGRPPPPAAAAAIAPCSGNPVPPPAGGEPPLDTTLGGGAEDVPERAEIAKSRSGGEVDAALVEGVGDGTGKVKEKQSPPAADIAPCSGNQVLRPADGEHPLDTTVGAGPQDVPEGGQFAKSISGGELDVALVEGVGDGTGKAEEKQADTVKGDTGSSRSTQQAAKALKLTKEIQAKIKHVLRKRSPLWIGFMNSEEEMEFLIIEDSVKSCNENAPVQTYINMLKRVTKMEKLINARLTEDLNREASLQKLQESIIELEGRPALTLRKQADLKKAKLLLSNKLEKQLNLHKFEDSILKCQEMDQMRKKLEEPSVPPVERYPSVPKEDIHFNPRRELLRTFIGYLRSRLIDHKQYGMILNSFLLPYQTNAGEQPPKWFRIHLLGDGGDVVVIYVRADNGYFIGFENKHGVFQLAPEGMTELARLIPNAIFISCGGDYPSLMNYQRIEGGIGRTITEERLLDLLLDKQCFIEDIHGLSNYSHPPPGDAIEEFQKSLTRICIIICEVCRYNEILDYVDDGWLSGIGLRLTILLLSYMWNWEPMSTALRTWLTDKSRVLTDELKADILMDCPEEITNVLFLILNAHGPGIVEKSDSQSKDDGHDKGGSENDRPPKSDTDSHQRPPQDPPAPSSGTEGHEKPWPHHAAGHKDDASTNPGTSHTCDWGLIERMYDEYQSESGLELRGLHHPPAPSSGTEGHEKPWPHHAAGHKDDASTNPGTSHTCDWGLIERMQDEYQCGLELRVRGLHLLDVSPWPMPGKLFIPPNRLQPLADLVLQQKDFTTFPQLPQQRRWIRQDAEKPSRMWIRQDAEKPSRMWIEQQKQPLLKEEKPMPGYNSVQPVLNLIPPREVQSGVSSLRGQPLVEVYSVSANFPFVGNVVIFDQRWGMTICRHDGWDRSSNKFHVMRNLWMQKGNAASDFKDDLILTGPSRAITASEGFVIKVDVPKRGRKAREISTFSCKYGDSPIYNEPKICTIKSRRGCLYVTYAVLNEALEGFFRVRLRLPSGLVLGEGLQVCLREGARVYGIIRVRIDKHENASVLFRTEMEEAVQVSLYGNSVGLPLTRSVLPVPLGANLHVTGELNFVGCGISTVINHSIRVEAEKVHTEWVKNGMCSSAVQLLLRPTL